MKPKITFACLCIVGAMTANLATASVTTEQSDTQAKEKTELDTRVDVEWVHPKKYTDLRDRNFGSEKFRTYAFESFEEHLAELAESLPEGQRLKFKVTDVDLAGRLEPGSFSGLLNTIDDIRIMRNIDIPRMKFEYTLLDAQGIVIKEEEVNLKDMNYLNHTRAYGSDRPFIYEKRMLTRWFNKTFKDA